MAQFRDSAWKTMELPAFWEQRGLSIDGSVWFRKHIEIPPSWIGRRLSLELGVIDDFDSTYFNGEKVGSIGPKNPRAFRTPRKYLIPAKMVRVNKVALAVRVFDQVNNGGFGGPPEGMQLRCLSRPDDEPVPLRGPWRYAIEWGVDRDCPSMTANKWPSALYNAMIHGLAPYAFRGILWYQGESNRSRAAQYASLFSHLIRSWRGRFKTPQLPFYFVQLAGYAEIPEMPVDDAWAELRESQKAALRLDHTGMASAVDIGESDNIHPKNKQEVGRRLALLALTRTYRRKMTDSGPSYAGHKVIGDTVHIRFDHCGQGLCLTRGKRPHGFAIAGRDRKFVWAQAELAGGDHIQVRSPEICQPVAIRYAWSGNSRANLVNSAHLPASPFRTDKWPLTTAGRNWPD